MLLDNIIKETINLRSDLIQGTFHPSKQRKKFYGPKHISHKKSGTKLSNLLNTFHKLILVLAFLSNCRPANNCIGQCRDQVTNINWWSWSQRWFDILIQLPCLILPDGTEGLHVVCIQKFRCTNFSHLSPVITVESQDYVTVICQKNSARKQFWGTEK